MRVVEVGRRGGGVRFLILTLEQLGLTYETLIESNIHAQAAEDGTKQWPADCHQQL